MKRSAVITVIVVLAVLLGVGALVAKYGMNFAAASDAGPPGGGPPGGGGFEPMEAVQILDVRETTFQPTADLVGTVFAMRSVAVRNELSGVVTFVGFESGAIVEPGQVLLKQDDTTEKADLAAAKAAVRVAEANIAQVDAQIRLAEVELERFTSAQSGAVAEVEIDRARSRLTTTKADRERWVAEVDQAKARVAQVEARIGKMTLTAPFKARVGMRTIHPGQYLGEGSDVATIEEVAETIYLDFAMAQQYAPRVAPGTSVMARGDLLGPDPVRIEVVAMDASVNRETRNLRIRSIVDNKQGILFPGMFVQVQVPVDLPSQVLVVPTLAIRRAAYGNSVFLILPDETGDGVRAKQQFVTRGQTIGEDVVVTSGLKLGDRVAAAGSFKLRDGVKVMLAPPTPPGAQGAPAGGPPGTSGEALPAGGN
jgi:membrane fusion protein (multidrug efflux system)